MAVGIWTLVEKSGYLSILASSTFAASAYILIFVGGLVMTTGFLGFAAIIREQKSCLSTVSVPLSLCGSCLSTVSIHRFHSECPPVPMWKLSFYSEYSEKVSVGLCYMGSEKHHTCFPSRALRILRSQSRMASVGSVVALLSRYV